MYLQSRNFIDLPYRRGARHVDLRDLSSDEINTGHKNTMGIKKGGDCLYDLFLMLT